MFRPLKSRIVLSSVLLLVGIIPFATDAGALEQIAPHPKLHEQSRFEWNQLRDVQEAHGLKDSLQATPVIIRMTRRLQKDEERHLAAMVQRVDTVNGRMARMGRHYGANVTPAQLQKLLAWSVVDQVFTFPRHRVRPLPPDNTFGKTYGWTDVDQVWNYRDGNGKRYLGQGVTLCDMDSAADVFHPLMFRADGGLYAWLDVDGNGGLDPGVDGVDLNGNGTVEPGEVLKQMGGKVGEYYYGSVPPETDPFHTARHWLYADTNGNDTRDYGALAGFTEDTPAYGEPLFLADDVNDDGMLGSGEKLLRLKTSKFKGVYRPSTGIAYQRGVDLVMVPVITHPGHGTGVTSILAGGVPGRNWVLGQAPEADLLLIVQDGAEGELVYGQPEFEQNIIAGLDWAQSQGTAIVVHEYGTAFGEFADGSSPREVLIDEMTAEGMVQATAAHNFAGNPGRSRFLLDPGQSTTRTVTVSDPYGAGGWFYYLMGTLRWRGGQWDVVATLTPPGGAPLVLNEIHITSGGESVWGTQTVSPRGTGMVAFYYYRDNPTKPEFVPAGQYTLTVTNTSAQTVEVYSYLTDEGMYAKWISVDGDHDDTSSMAWPSTADTAIAVAAFQVNNVANGTEGDLANYSGRGPRIDGATTISLAAPADHYAALWHTPGNEGGGGHYMVFGGTSGALPQVAGAIALLLSKEPGLTPAQVKERLDTSGVHDDQTGQVPNDAWGAGRLSVPRLLFGHDLRSNFPPGVGLVYTPDVVLENGQATVTLDASLTMDDHDALSSIIFRWDDGYDGTVEQEGHSSAFSRQFTTAGVYWLLVEAEDSEGATDRALASVRVREPSPPSSSSSGTSWSGVSSSSWEDSSSLQSSSSHPEVSSSWEASSSSAELPVTSSTSLFAVSSTTGISSSSESRSSTSQEESSSAQPSSSATSQPISSSGSPSSGATSQAVSSSGQTISGATSQTISSSTQSVSGTTSHAVSSSGQPSSGAVVQSSSLAASQTGLDHDDDDGEGCGSCAQTDVPALWVLGAMLLAVRRRRT